MVAIGPGSGNFPLPCGVGRGRMASPQANRSSRPRSADPASTAPLERCDSLARTLYEYHPRIGFRFVPGLKARIEHEGGGYLLRTNESGFRCDHPFAVHRTPGTFRVLLFGDSYTAGDGVSNRDRFGDQLERLVPGTQVYNFGLSNTGTDQQYLIWREWAAALEYDLVVITVLVENIRRNVARFRPALDAEGRSLWMAKPYFTLAADGGLELGGVPVRKEPLEAEQLSAEDRQHIDRGGRLAWGHRLVNRLVPGWKRWLQSRSQLQPLPAYDRPDDPAWLLMKAILRQWISEVSSPVWIVPWPLYHYVEELASPRGYQARFAELAAELPRAELVDPLPELARPPLAERRAYRFATDPHPTPVAHRVVAQLLAQRLAPLVRRASEGPR